MSWAQTMRKPVAHIWTFMPHRPLTFLSWPLTLLHTQPKSKVILPLP